MTLKRVFVVSRRGNLCIRKERRLLSTIIPTMILYIKGIKVKIEIAHMNSMWLSLGLRTRNSVISSDKVND